MSIDPKKIYPLDLEDRKAVGVSLPFSGKSVFNLTYTTKDAIKNNLINFFLTGQGERYLRPELGTNLRKTLLFENITKDSLDQIKEMIREDIFIYFPRVVLTSLEVIPHEDENKVVFYIKYYVSETDIEDELLINFEQQ